MKSLLDNPSTSHLLLTKLKMLIKEPAMEKQNDDGSYMNGDILNGDIEVITMDDLPASLTVMSQEELQQKVSQQQQ